MSSFRDFLKCRALPPLNEKVHPFHLITNTKRCSQVCFQKLKYSLPCPLFITTAPYYPSHLSINQSKISQTSKVIDK